MVLLFNFLEDISPLVGPLLFLFWTAGDVWPYFQSHCESLTCMLAFKSGMIPADLDNQHCS